MRNLVFFIDIFLVWWKTMFAAIAIIMILTQLEELNSLYVDEIGIFLSFGLLVWVIRVQILPLKYKGDK